MPRSNSLPRSPRSLAGEKPPERPKYAYLRGRWWYWEPPANSGRGRVPLGSDQAAAFQKADELNADLAGSAAGTLRHMADAFETSRVFLALSPNTQRQYQGMLRALCAVPVTGHTLGVELVREIRPVHADGIYEVLVARHGPAMAAYVCRVARRVWEWGLRQEHVQVNPWTKMSIRGQPARKQRWTMEQIATFHATAERMGRPSMALACTLLYWWGWRPQDVAALTWGDVRAGVMVPRKTANTTAIELPIVIDGYPEVAAALAAGRETAPDDQAVIRSERTKEGYTRDGLSHAWRAVMDEAALPPDLQMRDLRATAVTELNEAGVDSVAASTHSGHLTADMRRRYARRTIKAAEGAAAARLKLKRGE